ncbi:ribosome assembly cofactor RimP [Cloacibacterium normanense]
MKTNNLCEIQNYYVYLPRIYGKEMGRLRKKAFFRSVTSNVIMDFRAKVEQLVHEFLETRKDLYLVDLKISAGDDITVILDGDEGLSLQDCLDASRAIEFNLDREEHDFALQVMSPGLSEPLKLPRQFKKNMGREIEVLLNSDEKIQGEVVAVDDEKVTVVLRYRRPKLIGKGKEDVVENKEIPYTEIKKALVVIKF